MTGAADGLVIGDARQQEEDAHGGLDGRIVPVAPRSERVALGEGVVLRRVAAGDDARRRDRRRTRRSGTGRGADMAKGRVPRRCAAVPCYGADGPARAWPGPTSLGEPRQQGEPAARPGGPIAEEALVGRRDTALGDAPPGRRPAPAAGGSPPPGRRASARGRPAAPPPRRAPPAAPRLRRAVPHLVGHLVALRRHAGPDPGADPLAPRGPFDHRVERRADRAGRRSRAIRRGPRRAHRAVGSTRASGHAVRDHDHQRRRPGVVVTRMSASATASSSAAVPRPASSSPTNAASRRALGGRTPVAETSTPNAPAASKPVGRDSGGVVAHVQAEVERVVRRPRHAAVPCRHRDLRTQTSASAQYRSGTAALGHEPDHIERPGRCRRNRPGGRSPVG